MKKSKAKTQTNKGRAKQNSRQTSRTGDVSKPKSGKGAALISTDIRKAYKNRLINAYFNRPH